MRVKALFLSANKPYKDFEQIVKIARAEGGKIFCVEHEQVNAKVKVLNILPCNYPLGYVVVVECLDGG